MTHRFLIRIDVPDDWQGPGTVDHNPADTAAGLAQEITPAVTKLVPPGSDVSISWNPPEPVTMYPAGAALTMEIEDRSRYDNPNEYGDFFNGVHLSQITPAHLVELDQVYTPVQMRPLKEALARYNRRGGGSTELERHGQIHVDARGAQQVEIHRPEGKKRKQARCGNCLERYDISDDPIETHHLAMQHKLVCKPVGGGAMYSESQRERLITEFNAQPHVVAMRERFEATGNALPAAANMPPADVRGLIASATAADHMSAAEAQAAEREMLEPAPWWRKVIKWLSW